MPRACSAAPASPLAHPAARPVPTPGPCPCRFQHLWRRGPVQHHDHGGHAGESGFQHGAAAPAAPGGPVQAGGQPQAEHPALKMGQLVGQPAGVTRGAAMSRMPGSSTAHPQVLCPCALWRRRRHRQLSVSPGGSAASRNAVVPSAVAVLPLISQPGFPSPAGPAPDRLGLDYGNGALDHPRRAGWGIPEQGGEAAQASAPAAVLGVGVSQ